MNVNKFRSVLLYVVAAVFFAEAALALFAPHLAAEAIGYNFQNVDALSEFRAVYLGMWSVLGTAAFLAARGKGEPVLGDVVTCAIVAESFARALSVALDGTPGMISFIHIAMEASAAVILFLRPTVHLQTEI